MHEYDVALKSVLSRAGGGVLKKLIGFEVTRWHNVELPAVRHRRADLLGETAAGDLIHVELQSTNHSRMARRMLEYALAIERKFDRFPEQAVLYVGEAPLRMLGSLKRRKLEFECHIVDIRDFDAEPWLESESLADNVLAVLMRLRDERAALRIVLERIARAGPEERAAALGDLSVLVGLRKLSLDVEREIEQMPILTDIRDHPLVLRGVRIGERQMLLGMIARRFGSAPDWVHTRLESLSQTELEQLGLRLLDVSDLEELFA